MDPALQDKSTAELVKQLSTRLSTLVQQEIELAKAEMGQKARRLGVGAGAFGAAGVLALLGAGARSWCFSL